MDRTNDVIKILKEEYGIETSEELLKAIDELGAIDLSPFCAEIPRPKEKAL